MELRSSGLYVQLNFVDKLSLNNVAIVVNFPVLSRREFETNSLRASKFPMIVLHVSQFRDAYEVIVVPHVLQCINYLVQDSKF